MIRVGILGSSQGGEGVSTTRGGPSFFVIVSSVCLLASANAWAQEPGKAVTSPDSRVLEATCLEARNLIPGSEKAAVALALTGPPQADPTDAPRSDLPSTYSVLRRRLDEYFGSAKAAQPCVTSLLSHNRFPIQPAEFACGEAVRLAGDSEDLPTKCQEFSRPEGHHRRCSGVVALSQPGICDDGASALVWVWVFPMCALEGRDAAGTTTGVPRCELLPGWWEYVAVLRFEKDHWAFRKWFENR